jgi:hypothetical protein
MTSVLRKPLLLYPVLSEGRRCGSASAVHEPRPAGPSARATPPRRPGSRVTLLSEREEERTFLNAKNQGHPWAVPGFLHQLRL